MLLLPYFLLAGLIYGALLRYEFTFPFPTMVPPDYSMWLRDGDINVRIYALDKNRICEMKVGEDRWLRYRIRNATGMLKDTEGVWIPLAGSPGSIFTPEPVLCFWYDSGPHFVVRELEGQSSLYAFGKKFTGRLVFDIGIELMACEPIKEKIYVYTDGRVYLTSPKEFIEIVRDIHTRKLENKAAPLDRVMPMKPYLETNFTDWDDLMVAGNDLYFIFNKYVYEWMCDRPFLLGMIKTDFFSYVLLPKPYLLEELELARKNNTDYLAHVLDRIFIFHNGTGELESITESNENREEFTEVEIPTEQMDEEKFLEKTLETNETLNVTTTECPLKKTTTDDPIKIEVASDGILYGHMTWNALLMGVVLGGLAGVIIFLRRYLSTARRIDLYDRIPLD